MEQYIVLSPDGFEIDFFPYNSRAEAERALKDFKKRYYAQGYYSSKNGEIPLDELEKHCQIKKISVNE
jgi:hypothetical protein